MCRYLKDLGYKNITPWVNNGKKHGLYRDNMCFGEKYDLVIILDSIQDDTFLYEELLEMGSKVIVLDHHDIIEPILEIQDKINLVSSMNDYPNPALCGAGVTLKFCLYIDSLCGTQFADEYYDLAACGTCADMMDLSVEAMENRYICSRGFSNVHNKAIKAINGRYPMNSTAVSFGIAPLVNAANRMNHNWEMLSLFLSDDDNQIAELIDVLKDCKEKQNEQASEVYEQIANQAAKQADNKVMFFVVEDAKNMSGLIANKVLEEYQRPIIITQKTTDSKGNEIYSGSLRAVGVDNFSKIVNSTHLAKALGHSNAAGFTVKAESKEEFENAIEEVLADVDFKQTKTVDIKLTQKQITPQLISWMKELNNISGQGFPSITVLIEDVCDYEVGCMKDGKHTKIVTPQMTFIKWNSDAWEYIPEEMSLSFIGTLDASWFGRKYTLQMIVDDFKCEELLEI